MAGLIGTANRLRLSNIIIAFVLLLFLTCPAGAYAVTHGDVNGDGRIDVKDVVLVMNYILELENLSESQKLAADVNGNGAVNISDVTLLMQKVLGLIDSFPLGRELIKDFIAAEGISPGKKVVVVLLDVSEPQNYKVSVGATALKYNESINGFLGEVYEEDAERGKAVVVKRYPNFRRNNVVLNLRLFPAHLIVLDYWGNQVV